MERTTAYNRICEKVKQYQHFFEVKHIKLQQEKTAKDSLVRMRSAVRICPAAPLLTPVSSEMGVISLLFGTFSAHFSLVKMTSSVLAGDFAIPCAIFGLRKSPQTRMNAHFFEGRALQFPCNFFSLRNRRFHQWRSPTAWQSPGPGCSASGSWRRWCGPQRPVQPSHPWSYRRCLSGP